jgi:hypothetical protein
MGGVLLKMGRFLLHRVYLPALNTKVSDLAFLKGKALLIAGLSRIHEEGQILL